MQKLQNLSIQVFLWILVYLISRIFLRDHYFFDWISHNWRFYFTLMTIAIIIYLIHRNVGWVMSLANIAGVLIGQFLGNYLHANSIEQITSDMEEQSRYLLSSHQHVFIWISVIVTAVIIAIIVETIRSVIRHKREIEYVNPKSLEQAVVDKTILEKYNTNELK